MKSIGTIIHKKTFPLNILDSNDRRIYHENILGFWLIRKYESDGTVIYAEHSTGYIYGTERENYRTNNTS